MINIGPVKLPEWLENPDPNIYLSDNYLVVDMEYDPTELVLSCWSLGKAHPKYTGKIKSKFGGIYDQGELLEDIKLARFIVAHFTKGAELPWLSRCGAKLEEILPWCTMIGEYVILGNRKAELSLDAVAKRYGLGGKEAWVSLMISGGIPPSQVPPRQLELYCRRDVRLTESIFLKQRNVLRKSGLLPVALTRNIVSPVLVEIEQNGLFTTPISSLHLDNIHSEFQTLESSLTTLTGGINQNSPKQIGEYLYDTLKFEELKDRKGKPIRTPPSKAKPEGGRKTGTDVLTALKAKTPEQEQFKDLITRIIALTDERDFLLKLDGASKTNNGIIRAVINQCVTQTHRFSSNGVAPYNIQFQNIARANKEYFGPRNGDGEWEILEIDQAQLEFRAAVHYGRDQRGLDDIWSGFDIHVFSAMENRILKADGSPDRQSAKEITFKPLYYGGWRGKWFKAFRARWPGIGKVQDKWILEVLKSKRLQIETGLIFYWPNCSMTTEGYVVPSTQICNYPIQSLCGADITPIALTYLWHYAKRLITSKNWLVSNTVHDQSLWEIRKEHRELFSELGVKCNTEKVYEYLRKCYKMEFAAPLGVGMKIGPRWSKGKEIEIDVHPQTGEWRIRKDKKYEDFITIT